MSERGKYFSSKLIALRGEKSQAQFASDLGIVQQTYSRYERGTMFPDFDTLLQIASKLKIGLIDLVGHIELGGREQSPAADWELREIGPAATQADVQMWKGRAQRAEKELHDIKNGMRLLLKIEPLTGQGPAKPGNVSSKPLTAEQSLAETAYDLTQKTG